MSNKETQLNKRFDESNKEPEKKGVHGALRMLRDGYIPTQTRADRIVSWGGFDTKIGLDLAFGNGFKPSSKTMKNWVKKGSDSKVYYADKLRFKNAIVAAIKSKAYEPDQDFIQFCLDINSQVGDAAILAIAEFTDVAIMVPQLNVLLAHDSSESVKAVELFVSKIEVFDPEMIDFGLAPTVANEGDRKMYGDINYTPSCEVGRLSSYDRAVAAAISNGYELTKGQKKIVEARTRVAEFFPANGGTPALGRVSDVLTRALGLNRC